MSEHFVYSSTNSIDNDHWSIRCPDNVYVGQTGFGCLVKINPTDMRAFRLIVQFGNSNNMRSTLNRQWTESEIDNVFGVASRIAQLYFKEGLIPQIIFAGNNSMEEENGNIVIGRKEPAMLHVHILGRGIQGKEYFGIPYCGPKIGEEFNLKGNGEGDFKKRAWNEEDLTMFREQLRAFF